MRRKNVELRCVTYKFSERTREYINAIRLDREAQEKTLFGFSTPLSNTDVLRFLIDQEMVAIEQRAAAADAQELARERKEAKLVAQRQRRILKRGGKK